MSGIFRFKLPSAAQDAPLFHSPSSSVSLLDLGVDVLYEVLSLLSPRELLELRPVCRTLQALADDEVLWRRHLLSDFHLDLNSSARLSGWRQLYKGMAKPHLWVWGEKSDSRLGLGNLEELGPHVDRLLRQSNGVPFPLELPLRDPEAYVDTVGALRDLKPSDKVKLGTIIELHPGGWSFVYLTSGGYLLASGTLRGGSAIPDERRSRGRYPWLYALDTPTLLALHDRRVVKVACGGSHLVAIAESRDKSSGRKNLLIPPEIIVWEDWSKKRAWSLPQFNLGQRADGVSRRIEQLENGWDFTAILIHETSASTSDRTIGQAQRRATTSSIFVWLRSWNHDGENALELPELPEPPSDLAADFEQTSEDPTQGGGHHIITRIGGGDGFIVALTASGLVYKLTIRGPDASATHAEAQLHAREQGQGDLGNLVTEDRRHAAQRRLMTRHFSSGATRWELLRNFCDPQRILEAAPDVWRTRGRGKLVQRSTRMTHLTAHFRQFVVYSAKRDKGQGYRSLLSASDAEEGAAKSPSEGGGGGIVLLGQDNAGADSQPDVKPALQGADIIKVVAGDWHYGALDAHGNVFTWGQWGNGALGVYDHFQAKGEGDGCADAQGASAQRDAAAARGREGGDDAGGASREAQREDERGEDSEEDDSEYDSGEEDLEHDEAEHDGRSRSALAPTTAGSGLFTFRFGLASALRGEAPTPRPDGPPVRVRRRRTPREVAQPTQVCFDPDTEWEEGVDELPQDSQEGGPYWLSDASRRGKEHFVFDIGFAGWHSGALSIERKLLQS